MSDGGIRLLDASPLSHSWPLPKMFGPCAPQPAGSIDASPVGVSCRPATAEAMRGSATAGLWECDLRDQALRWSPEVFALFGLPGDAAVTRGDAVAIYAEDSRTAMEALRAYAIRHRRGFTLDACLERPDGQRRWMRLTASVACEGGRAGRLFGTKRDITHDRARRAAAGRSAHVDPLTGLHNAAAFHALLADALTSDQVSAGILLLIDVGMVAQIGRRCGALAEEACLSHLGSMLADPVSGVHLAARLGEHRFAALLTGAGGEATAERSAMRLMRVLAEPIFWQGYLLGLAPLYAQAVIAGDASSAPDALLAIASARLSATQAAARR